MSKKNLSAWFSVTVTTLTPSAEFSMCWDTISGLFFNLCMLGVSVAHLTPSCGWAEPAVWPTQLCKPATTVHSKDGRVGLYTSPKLPEGLGSLSGMPAKLVGLHGSWGTPSVSWIPEKGVKWEEKERKDLPLLSHWLCFYSAQGVRF